MDEIGETSQKSFKATQGPLKRERDHVQRRGDMADHLIEGIKAHRAGKICTATLGYIVLNYESTLKGMKDE